MSTQRLNQQHQCTTLFVSVTICLYQLYPLVTILLLGTNSGVVLGQRYFACNSAYCAAYGKCPEFSCKGKNKMTLHNVTKCGCCNRCINQKAENDYCPLDITRNIPSDQCGPHLRCEAIDVTSGEAKCTKIKSECELAKISISSNPSQTLTSEPIPVCDEYGEYKAKQCKHGTICQCVNSEGKPIFGIAPYNEAKDMNCLCSRQFELFNRKLKEAGSTPIEPISFMRCKENGNYEEHQNHMDYDYCVHSKNGTLWDRPVVRSAAKDLPCYKKFFRFKTDCVNKYNEAMANITKLEQSGIIVVGYDVPRCDLDGTFAPVQCQNDRCYCVDQKGALLHSSNGPYQVSRYDALAKEQQCTCARHLVKIRNIDTKHRNKVTDLFRRYQCDHNGNYLPIQCSDSACYCVNPVNGYMAHTTKPGTFASVLKSDPEALTKLFCYEERFRSIFRITL